MSLLEAFKSEVEAYLEASKTTPTTFGQTVLGDPNFVFDLRAGRSPQIATVDKVRAFIREAAPAESAA